MRTLSRERGAPGVIVAGREAGALQRRGDLLGLLARAAVHDPAARAGALAQAGALERVDRRGEPRVIAAVSAPICMTSNARFGRRKSPRIDAGIRSSSALAISASTRGVAVAVSAIIGAFASPGRRAARRAACTPGRKSWPHWLTQCASSIAIIAMRARPSRRLKPSSTARSGETYSSASSPRISRPIVSARAASSHWLCSAADRDAAGGERAHLIVHQRDQRRDHDRRAFAAPRAHDRRHLIAQRLAGAGRQEDERVAVGQQRPRRLRAGRGETRRGRTPRAAPRARSSQRRITGV